MVLMRKVAELEDLGVLFTAELTFQDHIATVCKKAYRILGLILRKFHKFASISAIIALYYAFLRSVLECNAVVWAAIILHLGKFKTNT